MRCSGATRSDREPSRRSSQPDVAAVTSKAGHRLTSTVYDLPGGRGDGKGSSRVMTSIQQSYDLVGRDRPWRWVLLIGLALLVSGLEMVGAVIVYTLLGLVADPGSAIEVPLVGDLRAGLGGVANTTLLLWVVAAMAVFFVIRSIVKIVAKYVQARVAHNAGSRLSAELFEGYLLWPYSRHLTRPTAELIRNSHEAVQNLVGNVLLPVIRIVAEGLLVVAMLVVLVVLAPLATLAAVLVVGGAAVLLLLAVQPRLKRLGAIRHDESQSTLTALQQGLFGIRDVKVLGREAEFADAYRSGRGQMARADYLRDTATHLPSIVLEMALLGFILAYFAITLLRGGAAQDTLSVLGLFAYAGLRLQPSLQLILAGLNKLRFSAAPLQDLHDDLATMDRVRRPREQTAPLPFSSALTLEHITFRYEHADHDALTDISLTITRGEQIGICGPTGGGKTTLVDVITGLLPPTTGRVLVDGQDLRDHEREWHAALGIVPQTVFLTDDTLRRNIALGVPDQHIDDDAVREAVRLAQLDEFVNQLPDGLETTVGERGVRVSGGQRQRVAVARALYRSPSVLVFDEGTSALDNATEALLMDAIERLRGRHTILLVAHRLSTVRNCDRIVFLEHGRMTGLGTYDDLQSSNAGFRALSWGS
jgi:ATP-binding cassette, subfamily B, bacterial PglK